MTDKVIFIFDRPKECCECPCFDESDYCKAMDEPAPSEGIRNDCPLRHPLKEVSNDFYIYDTEYLFKNLDREIDLLKSTERFKEYMRNREE